MKTGFEYWSCNRPSIQDATPEERPTASPAVGRGAGLFVALGTSTRHLSAGKPTALKTFLVLGSFYVLFSMFSVIAGLSN